MAEIKLIIIDDSAVMRKFLTDIVQSDPEIVVSATAMDPIIAVNKIKTIHPDVITLDIEMPRMDGLTFLSKLMIANPVPVIMVSTLTEKGARETMKALELGAVDFIAKPDLEKEESVKEFSLSLIEKIKGAKISKVKRANAVNLDVEKKFTADVILEKKDPVKSKIRSEKIIAIGASTGGTEVIDEILSRLPDNLPGIVITQHMPEKFTLAFADRVNKKSKLFVKEAADGDRLYNGMALIAPGGKHMLLNADSNGYRVDINDGPPVNRHKPSVDVLFRSVSQCAGGYALGIILTGMGNDGAQGLLEMKLAGSKTIGQNESSCIVYGMPKEAFKLGAVDSEKDIKSIIESIVLYGRS
jgi:two-component system chemotaxis response regulator CheB